MTDKEQPIRLEGDAAVELWRQGFKVWNQWVKENPNAIVFFNRVEFSEDIYQDNPNVSFFRYIFPNGGVNFEYAHFSTAKSVTFSQANFGDGHVSFADANFGSVPVDFTGANFGQGHAGFTEVYFGNGVTDFSHVKFGNDGVNFNGSYFGEGDTIFHEASFGEGRVSFIGTKFGDGKVDFSGASFGNGDVSFSGAKIGLGKTDFSKANFSDGKIDFSKIYFGDGDVDFSEATFGDGKVDFSKANFGSGNVDFSETTFGNGRVNFSKANFDGGEVNFESATFGGHVSLFELENIERLVSFNMRHCIFEKSLDISNNNFNCVIDLTNTQMNYQVSLEGLSCRLHRTWLRKAKDGRDGERFLRLKAIAENNKDHAQALSFHADEMQAKRWHKLGWLASMLDMLYSATSDYGQSIIRPALLLLAFALMFTALYVHWSDNHDIETVLYAVELTAANMLPFLTPSKQVMAASLEALYGYGQKNCLLPGWYNLASIAQSLIMFVLLFLVGLGLRNRFRI